MKKKIALIIIFFSVLFSSETIKFIFWDSENEIPLYGKKNITVKYKLKKNQKDITEGFKILSPDRRRYDNTYNVYRIEADYNELIIGDGDTDCELNKLYLDFKIYIGSDKFYTGSQVLIGDFWDCEKIGSDQAMTYGGDYYKNTYFSNNEIVEFGGRSKNPIIKIVLNPPKLTISGTLRDAKLSNKINSDVEIKLNSFSSQHLYLQNSIIDSKTGEYSLDVQLKPDASDISNNNYSLYFIAENYYSKFVDIENDRLLNGKEQIENIKLEPRHPFLADSTINPSQNFLFYNTDCMRWICKDNPNTSINESQTQIYIKKTDECADKCPYYSRSQITDGKHECAIDSSVIIYRESSGISSYQEEFDNCIENYSRKLNNSDFTKGIPLNMNQIEETCRKNVGVNIPDDQQYQIFMDIFLDDYEGECVFGDYIKNGLCDDRNQDIIKDYYFLIKFSRALYKNIRLEYSDSKIKNMIEYQNWYFNDIERLILLYNRTDALEQESDLIALKSNHHAGDVPDYVYLNIVADHYMQRIEFYSWYYESLFYLNKMYEIKGKHRVYDEDNKQEFNFRFLCDKNPIPSGQNVISPKPKNILDFLEILYTSLKQEIKTYKNYGKQASKVGNYKSRNILIKDIKKKIGKLNKELED